MIDQIDTRLKALRRQILKLDEKTQEDREELSKINQALEVFTELEEQISIDIVFDNPFDVQRGQYWTSNDPRQKGRVFRIKDMIGDYAITETVYRDGENVDPDQTHEVRLDRFDSEKQKGYSRVSDQKLRNLGILP